MKHMDEKLIRRLRRPEGKVDVVLDTDTYNEIDDQFALSYLVKSDDKLNLKAVYAAPFHNHHSSGPADGIEKSYQEIMNLFDLMDRQDLKALVYRGSERYLPSEIEPVVSPAAEDLAKRAMEYTEEDPLYVLAIGAITNVASAILINPQIVDRIVIVWLGGNAHNWPNNKEFNLYQDVAAARIIFGCGAAFVQLPCSGVVSNCATSGPELDYWLRGKNKLCDYLVAHTVDEAAICGQTGCWTRVIWDITPVAWLLDESFMEGKLVHAPIPEYDHHYAQDETRHFMNYIYHVDRDKIFTDLFAKLAK